MASVLLEEQQEKLRRAVDSWRSRSHDLLRNLQCQDPNGSLSAVDAGSSNLNPIQVMAEPLEHSNVLSLVNSDNVAVSKFITVLFYDCFEISRLCRYASRHMFKRLLLFGYRSTSQEILLEGEPQKAFGQSLSLFMELSDIICRMSALMGNLLQQLDSVYSSRETNDRLYKLLKNAMFRSGFISIGDGLSMFLVLDEILIQNKNIKSYLSLFMRMLNKVKMEPDYFGISIGDLKNLKQVVSHLEKAIDVGLFRRLFLEESLWQEILQNLRRNKRFLDACTSFVHSGLLKILSRLDTWKEYPIDRRKILSYLGLAIFGAYASAEAPERRVGKLIVEMIQVVPVVYIEGCIRLMLFDLLKDQFPQSLSSWPTLKEVAREYGAMRRNYLSRLTEIQARDWQGMKDVLTSWVASFQSSVHPLAELSTIETSLRLHMKQIIQGVLLANRMQTIAISMLDLHALLEVPIRRETLKSLCHMVVLLKVIQNAFHKKGLDIIQSLPHMIHLAQTDIEQLIFPAKEGLLREISKGSQMSNIGILSSLLRGKNTDTRLTDSLSLVLLSLQMLQGGGGSKRRLILSITIDAIQSVGHLNIDILRIEKLISKVDIVADFEAMVEDVTNCSFLYFKKEMIGSFLSMVFMDVNKFSWLQYVLDAFGDGLWLLKQGRVSNYTLQLHEEEIEYAVKHEIVTPLCRDIETDLRLHVHSTQLKGSVHVNPTKGVRNLSWFLQMKLLRLPFKFIDIKLLVENYLNSAFYNHTVMSSHDWKIYLEMRQLAEMKYSLVLDDIHLPGKSLHNDIDISEIIQDLPKFAANYSYNLYTQVFVEKVSSGQGRKNLRTFGVDHVASSVGALNRGILSTSVSSVYKFLTQKIASLSELLQSSHAQSLLAKELSLWKSDKEAVVRRHFTVQAVESNSATGNLRPGDYEWNIFQQLLSIISEIGNVLGFVRSLQAGDSRHALNISHFISRSGSFSSYAETSRQLGLVDEVITAGRMVDIATENTNLFEEHSKYFSYLISPLSSEFQSNKYVELKEFFRLIPALISCFLHFKFNMKEKMLRGRDAGNQTPDDGFMMGVAYVLQVTGQEKSFDGMQWFVNAIKDLKVALHSLEESKVADHPKGSGLIGWKIWSQAAPPVPEEVQKEIDKIKRYQMEIELIQFNLNVSRTILRSDS